MLKRPRPGTAGGRAGHSVPEQHRPGGRRRPALEEGAPTGHGGGRRHARSSLCRRPRGHGGHAPFPPHLLRRGGGWLGARPPWPRAQLSRSSRDGNTPPDRTPAGRLNRRSEERFPAWARRSRPESKSPALTTCFREHESPRDHGLLGQPVRITKTEASGWDACLSVPADPQPGRRLCHGGTEKAAEEGRATRGKGAHPSGHKAASSDPSGGRTPSGHAATKPRPLTRGNVSFRHTFPQQEDSLIPSHKKSHDPMTEDT